MSSIKPLAEEVYTDVLKGDVRRLDIVIEAKIKHTDSIIIIHIEPQSYLQGNFTERMFQYFNLLHNTFL